MEENTGDTSSHPLTYGIRFHLQLAKIAELTHNRSYKVASPYNRLIWQAKGHATYIINGIINELYPNTLLLLPANTPMQCIARQGMRQYFCFFQAFTALGTPLFDLIPPQYNLLSGKKGELGAVKRQFEAIIEGYTRPTPRGLALAQGRLSQLIGPFLPDNVDSVEQNAMLERLGPAIRFIHNHYADQISLVVLAELVGYSTNHFSHAFSALVGLSPQAYIVQQRIQRAKELLVTTDETLLTIALQCGYSDGFNLSRQFKRSTGLSPKQYRKQAEVEGAIDS